MNWIDFLLIALLLAAVIIGSKKGLVRELSAFIVVCLAVVLSINYLDSFAVWVYNKIGGSSLVSAFVSFVILLAGAYGLFKLLAWLFYKVASIKSQGKQDQVGGAIVGLIRGWVSVGVLAFLVFLLPMPESFYLAYDSSLFGKVVAKTVPLMYEGTRVMHPSNPSFMTKVETTLLTTGQDTKNERNQKGTVSDDREKVYRVMYQIDRFFNTSGGS
ncbi:MAG: CvpA family protein [Candidatus Zixiibacteriota bacterium]